jgi:hypothetical protein
MITVPDSIPSLHNVNTRSSFKTSSRKGKFLQKSYTAVVGLGILDIIVKEDSSFSGAQGATSRTDDKRNELCI